MPISVIQQSARYQILKRSRNQRWNLSDATAPARVDLCDSPEDAALALQQIVSEGLRPTVRSGNHCYEDFAVNNPGGALLDLSLHAASRAPGGDPRYYIAAGKSLGDTYNDLYKRYGLTIPAGTCPTVGAGGHISGGGYGLLSRLRGLTCDWVSAVDILTVDAQRKVTARRVDKKTDADLFRACRGAGGGSFGVITGFLFDQLPPAPVEVARAAISFDWASMNEARFVAILTTYGNYWATRGKDPDTWGMFSVFPLSHSSAGSFGLTVQFCNPDGTCNDLKPLDEFLDLFEPCNPTPALPGLPEKNANPQPCAASRSKTRLPWIDATTGRGGGGNNTGQRAKYKSSYMRRNFTILEAKAFYKHLNRQMPGVDLRGSLVAVDSYGGATNRPELANETAIWQRDSIMKLQFQSYWARKEQDAGRLQWMKDFFTDVYSPAPYPDERYEGCYINYPDVDMLEHKNWPQLYYGTSDSYPILQGVKRHYDPNNIFHHAMSVKA